MGKSLRVLDSGSWETVKTPHIMEDGSWKTVHKVSIMHGGVWKESHKTSYTEYAIGTTSVTETQSNGSWTVPDNTRYIKVKIWGSGAGGGGGGDTGYLHPSVPFYRYRITGASSNTGHSHPAGGGGGHGGFAEMVLETRPGVTFSWTGLGGSAPAGGDGARAMILGTQSVLRDYNDYYTVGVYPHQGIYTPTNQNYRYDPGHVDSGTAASPWTTSETYGFFKVPDVTTASIAGLNVMSSASPNAWARDGTDATDIVFTGDSPTSGDPYIITAAGGNKGFGGRHYVTASAFTWVGSNRQHSLTIVDANPSTWAHDNQGYDDFDSNYGGYKSYGAATASGNGSSFESSTLTRGGGMEGGAGYSGPTLYSEGYNYGGDGSPGALGKLSIETYQ